MFDFNNNSQKKAWFKVIVFLTMLILIEFLFYSFDYKAIFNSVSSFLESPHRTPLIWGFCIVVCVFHYLFVVLKSKESSKFFVKTSNDFLDLVSSFTTYAVVMNSSLRVLSGIIKEFTGESKVFVDANSLDFYTILASNFLPIIWICSQLVKLVIVTIGFKKEETEIPNINIQPPE